MSRQDWIDPIPCPTLVVESGALILSIDVSGSLYLKSAVLLGKVSSALSVPCPDCGTGGLNQAPRTTRDIQHNNSSRVKMKQDRE